MILYFVLCSQPFDGKSLQRRKLFWVELLVPHLVRCREYIACQQLSVSRMQCSLELGPFRPTLKRRWVSYLWCRDRFPTYSLQVHGLSKHLLVELLIIVFYLSKVLFTLVEVT